MSDAQHKQEGLPVDLMFFCYNSFRECVCVCVCEQLLLMQLLSGADTMFPYCSKDLMCH